MNVLIIEDSLPKYKSTAEYVRKVADGANITWCESAKVGVNSFIDCHFDFAIIDMQMPINCGDRIDREGGIYVLNYIKREKAKNPDMKFCINSSSKDTLEVLKAHGFEDVVFILNSSMYNCTESFRKFLTK